MAHSGPTAEGSFVQTLTLTDIATGWTECAPLLVREQKLLTDVLNELVRRHLGAVTTAAAEDARERALSLRSGPPAAPLLRTLRRLRSDVAFLGRAMAFEPGKVEVTLGCVIGALTAHLVLPDRARAAIKTGAAGMLDGLGKLRRRI